MSYPHIYIKKCMYFRKLLSDCSTCLSLEHHVGTILVIYADLGTFKSWSDTIGGLPLEVVCPDGEQKSLGWLVGWLVWAGLLAGWLIWAG